MERNFLRNIFGCTLFVVVLALCSCAGMRDDAPEGGANNDMADTACDECGNQGDIELKITDEKFYREWNQVAYSHMDSSAVVGVFPSLKIVAKRPEKCKMCHSFSADALDFDLAHVEDSLFVKAFPKMQRELMLPGMRLPDADSLYLDTLSVMLLKSEFADGMRLDNMKPWQERDGIEQTINRTPPTKFRNLLNDIASRYGLRYLSIPVFLEVEMIPDLGRSGGYKWKILWSLWDARYGDLVFLTYSEFTAATTSRVAPEKDWSVPFGPRLWKMFSVDFGKLENH